MKKYSLFVVALATACSAWFVPVLAEEPAASPTRERSGPSKEKDAPQMSKESGKLSNADKEFVMKAAMGGMAEVELGKVAEKKAGNPEVKSFGKMMVSDHGGANKKLKEIASSKGIALTKALDSKHEAQMEKLSKLSGDEFDKAYIKAMINDHEDTIALFKKAVSGADDAQIKEFASETLPTLQAHLKKVESLKE